MHKRNYIQVFSKVKLVSLAATGALLSFALLFITAWALQDSVVMNNDIYSDHAVSLKDRVREVLLQDSEIWQQIINNQISIRNNQGASAIVTAGYILTGIDLNNPATFLKSQIPGFEASSPQEISNSFHDDTVSESGGPDLPSEVVENGAGYELTLPSSLKLDSNEPLLFIYHTHNTEAYLPTCGTRYKESGIDGTVVKIGAELERLIEKEYHIPVEHSRENHIWEPFWAAYTHSLQTVETTLKTNQSLKYVIDIHNDGVNRELTTTKIKGVDYARVYLVVGADRIRNPKWQQNYKFALRLQEKLEQRYPGLSRGILLQKTARYNQHLCDNSVLIEMGGYQNSYAEAQRTTVLFAEILAEVIMEDIAKGN